MLKPGLRKLDRFLARENHGDDAMLLSEFDGFIAGIVVCPDLLMPSEWLEVVWGDEGPVFESEREANDILGLMMTHYNDVVRQLERPGRYAPLLEKDVDGSILWEMWAAGFAKAIALRPEAWTAFTLSDDPAVLRAMILFRKLDELANRPGDQFTEEDDALDASAPDMIPEAVETLHAARLALTGSLEPSAVSNKPVGRNDPCPCGSGKKFKKCCLN